MKVLFAIILNYLICQTATARLHRLPLDLLERVQSYRPFEKSYQKTLDQFKNFADPYANIYGKSLFYVDMDISDSFQVFADEVDDDWVIYLSGGVYRHSKMNESIFVLILCHELGHFLGKAPYFLDPDYAKFSNEGQADYFAGSCLKDYLKELPEKLTKKSSKRAIKICQENYEAELDLKACAQTLDTAKDLTKILSPRFLFGKPKLKKKDLSQVDMTLDSYPSLQCRLDTIKQGALCSSSLLSGEAPCNEALGSRPSCWYKEPLD